MRYGKWGICIVLFASTFAKADTVVLNAGGQTTLNTVARDASLGLGGAQSSRMPSALPYVDTDSVTNGSASSTTSYNFSQAMFGLTMSQSRPGTLDSRADSVGSIFFSVTQDVLYGLAGSYSSVDSNPRQVLLFAKLTDVDTSAVLFSSEQISRSTANQSFVLGGTSGDFSNTLSGSSSGTLTSGHRYVLEYQSGLYAHQADPDGAIATGNLTLSLTPTGTPLPTAACAGLMLMGVMNLRRSRRGRTA